jgi:mannosyltransferase
LIAWLPAWSRRGALTEAAVLVLLALGVALTIVWVGRAPQTRLAFPIDSPPAGTIVRGVYGVERNATGAFVWMRPSGSISVPLAAPGRYRLTLLLQESPLNPSPRTLALNSAGVAAPPVVVTTTPALYSIEVAVPARAWATGDDRTRAIEWEVPAFVAPGDSRALGFILTGVRVEPLAPAPALPAELLLPALLLLALGYAALRALGLAPLAAGVMLALALLAVAVATTVAHAALLILAYRLLPRPLLFVGALLTLAPVPFVGRARLAVPDAAGRRFWSRRSWPILPLALAALALRLWGLDRTSLWRDEGYTVLFTHLPWRTLLGLGAGYDVHPPLYYVLTRLVARALPDAVAGRALSAVAGTLTIVALYACAVRLLNRRAALIAAAVLALAPLHLWYSQEARMYTVLGLCVALALLALVGAAGAWSPWWVALCGGAILLALYTDTTALYALVPLAFVGVALFRDRPRRGLALAGATGAALLLFAPWALRNAAISGTAAQRGASYLDVSAAQLGTSALALLGVDSGGYYWGDPVTPWNAWPAARPLLAAVALLAAGGAFVLVARRGRLVAATVAALTVALCGVATLISLLTPAFADRTLLPALGGWALLVGAATGLGGRRTRAVVGVGLAATLLVSTVTLVGVAQTGTRQDYRAFAAAVHVAARDGLPLLTNDAISDTLIELYQPGTLTATHRRVTDLTATATAMPLLQEPGAFWFAYADYPFLQADTIGEQLRALGFERRSHQTFPDDLALDLYARPGVTVPSIP